MATISKKILAVGAATCVSAQKFAKKAIYNEVDSNEPKDCEDKMQALNQKPSIDTLTATERTQAYKCSKRALEYEKQRYEGIRENLRKSVRDYQLADASFAAFASFEKISRDFFEKKISAKPGAGNLTADEVYYELDSTNLNSTYARNLKSNKLH
jgi:hypothetical protein